MDIPLITVESSNVEAIGYDEPSQTIRVRFKGGKAYDYPEQTPADWAALQVATSKGRAVAAMKAGQAIAGIAQEPAPHAESTALEVLTTEASACCGSRWARLPDRGAMDRWTCPSCGLDFVVRLVGTVRSWEVESWSARI